MAGRPATQGTAEGWERVKERVRDRRYELNLVGRDIEAAGVSTSVLSLIENAKKDRYETRLLRRLEQALDWRVGSIDAILRGGEPHPLEVPAPHPNDIIAAERGAAQDRGMPAALSGKIARLSPAQRELIEAMADEMLGPEGE